MTTMISAGMAPVSRPTCAPVLRRKCACGGTSGPTGECEQCRKKRLQRAASGSASGFGASGYAPPVVHEVLGSSGRPLDSATRAFMEPRFSHDFSRLPTHGFGGGRMQARLSIGRVDDPHEREADQTADRVLRGGAPGPASDGADFSGVRVHADAQSAESAQAIGALAYTVGNHIVFDAGRYAPDSGDGRRLLAHELAHVVQQSNGPLAASSGLVQRAPTLSVLDADFIGPPSPTQRRAAATCPITCCDNTLGTLNAMPLFEHQDRGAIIPAGGAAATGIGAEIHFTASGKQPEAGDRCHCDDYRIVQIVTTTDPAPGRGGNSYVDNNGTNTPFYGDVFLHGQGEHPIPQGYADAGERVTSTESIYDRPSRSPATLPHTNLDWKAESCVACVKNEKPDRILGCVTYGFTRNFNPSTHAFDPVVPVGPNCRGGPSQHFIGTLGNDPTTSAYKFKGPPSVLECAPVGDFPTPKVDTRLA